MNDHTPALKGAALQKSGCLLLVLVSGAILLVGYGYYQRRQQELRQNAQETLAAIADLKVGQIRNWMKERRDDAKAGFAMTHLRQCLTEPDNAMAIKETREWMTTCVKDSDFSALKLFDSRGTECLAVSADAPPLAADCAERVREALHAREVVFTDLQRGQADGPIYFGFMVPIGIDPQPGQLADGVLVFLLDPRKFLYPLVRKWPTSSRTAETLLVRREGDSVVYLNELRHRPHTALELRLPLSQPHLPAAQAVLGQQGEFEDVDYRGVPVLAAVRKISGTPWFMVAKVDQEEIFDPLHHEAWLITLIICLLLLTVTLAFSLLWRQQKLRLFQRELVARQQAEERYRLLFSNMTEGVASCRMIFDHGRPQDFVYLAVNEAFTTLTGLRDVVGRKISEVLPGHRESDPELFRVYGRVASTGKPEYLECYVTALDQWLSISVYSPKNEHFAAVFEDVTERKQAEAEHLKRLVAEKTIFDVKAVNQQLEAANKELEAFSYSVSHDLRAPLRHVAGYVNLLTRRFPELLPDEPKRYLNHITEAVCHMGTLIDDLLRFFHTGRMEIHQSDLDMNGMLRDVIAALPQDEPQRDVEWIVAALPPVSGDPAMLRLVWVNLLDNALKFTRTRARARIEIGTRDEDGGTVFFVRDNGVGFDMKYADKLFGVFQRLHAADEFKGSGIGLANVQRIIQRHGGRVWAEAAPDQGATFSIFLPKTDHERIP